MHLSPVRDVQDHCEQSGSPQVIAYTDIMIMAVKKADGTETSSPISEMAKRPPRHSKLEAGLLQVVQLPAGNVLGVT